MHINRYCAPLQNPDLVQYDSLKKKKENVRNVCVQCAGALQLRGRGVLHQGSVCVFDSSDVSSRSADAARGHIAAPGTVGVAGARVAAVPQGRPAPPLQGPHPQVRLPDLHPAGLPVDRGPQRLQDDQGCVPQGGIHRPTHHRIHKHPRRLW